MEHLCSSRNSDEARGKHTSTSQMKGRLVQMFQTSGKPSAFMWSRTGSTVAGILSEPGVGSWKRTREECPRFTAILSSEPHKVNRQKNDPTVTTQFFQTRKRGRWINWRSAPLLFKSNYNFNFIHSGEWSENNSSASHMLCFCFCVPFKYLPPDCKVCCSAERKTTQTASLIFNNANMVSVNGTKTQQAESLFKC